MVITRCGLNGALYFVSMDADGGSSKYPTNVAGAKYGTGYCDSQCPRDLKFIAGQANVDGWEPSANNNNTGIGGNGSCCSEMDIWEANSISEALTPHPCETIGQYTCSGNDCGGTYSTNRYAGECDPDGCDWNPYRLGNTTFYGPGSGFTIDTTKTVTVVTQFASTGISRYYVQNGVKFVQPNAQNIPGYTGNEITTEYCAAEQEAFGGTSFTDKGGLTQMNQALSGGMVLVMSLWDDVSKCCIIKKTKETKLTNDFNSTRSTCSGWIQPTQPTVPLLLAPTEEPALPAPVFPPPLNSRTPTPRLSSPTSSLAPLVALATAPPALALPLEVVALPALEALVAQLRLTTDSAVVLATPVLLSVLAAILARSSTSSTLSACNAPHHESRCLSKIY